LGLILEGILDIVDIKNEILALLSDGEVVFEVY